VGADSPVRFEQGRAGLALTLPATAPRQPANVYRIEI
jgi:hypothetical protein